MLTDFMGQQVLAGDTIAYPVRRSSKMWLSELKVTQIIESAEPVIRGYNTAGRLITIHNVKNVIKVQPRKV